MAKSTALKRNCLYSTNPWIKWFICKEWRNDIHYVWCSTDFDPSKLGAEDRGSLVPPTSNPARIFSDLYSAVKGPVRDRHNAKIMQQKAFLVSLAEKWRREEEISDDDANEIIYILQEDDRWIWRPLIYVIPCGNIQGERIVKVPMKDRAWLGSEYKIHDLKGCEFDRIEIDVDR